MIAFRFNINRSFLKYSTHPITVPRGRVDYDDLVHEQLDKGDFVFVLPNGERLGAHMYLGQAGFGQYYQLRTYPDQTVPGYLSVGNKVLVIVVKDGRKRYAIMEYRE